MEMDAVKAHLADMRKLVFERFPDLATMQRALEDDHTELESFVVSEAHRLQRRVRLLLATKQRLEHENEELRNLVSDLRDGLAVREVMKGGD